MVDHNVPIFLDFKNIGVSINGREILKTINGKVRPGEMLALMGPSGSGKTTLLNVLAGRMAKDAGDVLINGKHMNKKLKKRIGYVMQEDIFFSHLTLKETLTYSAMLRLPDTLSKAQKLQKVDEIVKILDLSKCLHTCIGSPMERGLSGGEKKRANIGCELIINPSLIFLDEPTSGLDSSNAMNLIKTLQDYCLKEKKTIVTSIHQPSSQIYHLFDKLLLLCNGQMAYYGKASKVLEFFESINLICAPHFNPADFILEKVTAGSEVENRIVESWAKRSKEQKKSYLNHSGIPLSSGKTSESIKESSRAENDLEMVEINGFNHLTEDGLPTASSKDLATVLSQENLSFQDSDNEDTSDNRIPFGSDIGSDTELMNEASPDTHTSSKLNGVINGSAIKQEDHKVKNRDLHRPNSHSKKLTDEVTLVSFKKTAVSDVKLNVDDDNDDDDDYTDVHTGWVTSFWTQFTVLTERTFKQSKPEILSKLNFIQTFVLSIIVGLIWFRIPYTEETIRDRYAVVFFVIVYWNLNPMFSALVSFPAERTIINKERAAGYYRLSAYYFAKLFSELPLVVCQPIGFMLVAYWMCGLNESVAFLTHLSVLLLTSITAQSIGLCISASIMDFKKCITVAAIFGLTMMLLGGFYQQHIPWWLEWFEYLSFMTYTYRGCVIAEFATSPPFRCSEVSAYASCKNGTWITGTEVLHELGIHSSLGENVAYLLPFCIVFRALAYFSLRFIHKPK
ncbi:ABC transporter G family member 21 [Nematostella vectensis]|uniref:ABC transporter G family member 21 n=1 Tax=Nematostella vectensis TaxID=45351 RepID=UPI0013902363|nr:ABC transporter G family member 21 [Nematostella vectensis]